MILDLKDIFINQKDRLQVSYSKDLLSSESLYENVSCVNIDAEVTNSAGVVKLNLNISFSYDAPCDRCAVNLHKDYKNSFNHILVLQCTEDKDDYIVIENYSLDLDLLARDDILLDKPSKILCSNDCKGLCPKCGVNRNYEKCNCKSYQVDPRLEVLKQFIDKN